MSSTVNVAEMVQSPPLQISSYQAALQTLEAERKQVQSSVLQLLSRKSALCSPSDLFEALITEEEIRRQSRQALYEELIFHSQMQEDTYSRLEDKLETLKNQLKTHQSLQDRKTKKPSIQSYDLIITVEHIGAIFDQGWEVHANHLYSHLFAPNEHPIVTAVGVHNSGKTHLLNLLMDTQLPTASTSGLSFKSLNMDLATQLILLDTPGLYKPLRHTDACANQEVTELLLNDIVLSLSDYFIYVVGNWTSIEQRFLQKIANHLAMTPNRVFREIIIIHNLKEINDNETLSTVWNRQIAAFAGTSQSTQIAARNPVNGKIEHKRVKWAKSEQCRHVSVVDDYSELGETINPWTVALVKTWLKGIVVSVPRDKSVIERFCSVTEQKLSIFYRQSISVKIHSSESMCIIGKVENKAQMRLTDMLLASGISDQSVENFTPPMDIVKTESHFIVCIDLPGVELEDVTLSRVETVTMLAGRRRCHEDKKAVWSQRERVKGDFIVSFSVPQEYEKRWSTVQLQHGVLTLQYPKDISHS